MTAATLTHQPAASIRSDARLSFARILRSEWIKLTSLRSTVWSLALIVVLGVGLSLMIASLGSALGGEQAVADPNTVLTATTIGVGFGQLIAAVLGVLVISGEYSTGMIKSTLAAVPGRVSVLVAKSLVLFTLVTAVGFVTVFGSWAATYPIFESQGAAVSLGDDGLAVALAGSAVYLGLVAVFAIGLGTLLRSTAGGLAAALGVLLVLDTAVSLLAIAADWVSDITPYLFSQAGAAMAQLPFSDNSDQFGLGTLEPWQGALVALAWTLVAFTLGAIRLKRQDA